MLYHIPLHYPALVGYLLSQGIERTIAFAYCREVHYAVSKREYFAIGFRNDIGGWAQLQRKPGESPEEYIARITALLKMVAEAMASRYGAETPPARAHDQT